jgi:hypothetical protein
MVGSLIVVVLPCATLSVMVYFISAHSPDGDIASVKIGHSDDPRARLREMQVGSPLRLSLISMRRGGRKAESELHRTYRKWRSFGEWFEPSIEVLSEATRCPHSALQLRETREDTLRALFS